jgi:hypothetical protein
MMKGTAWSLNRKKRRQGKPLDKDQEAAGSIQG